MLSLALRNNHARMRHWLWMIASVIFGIFRPLLLLPHGIEDRLTQAQLNAIIAHEICHVRRHPHFAAVEHRHSAADWTLSRHNNSLD
jgi:beta-lactamase regulating signal transducer with metallopeptidase domain